MNAERREISMNDKELHLMPGSGMIWKMTGRGKGVLLLHGFLGTPYEMGSLAQRLSSAGFSVYAPRYPGHGTTIEEMTRTDVSLWYECAREAYLELKAQCREVYIAGLSMGSLFAILLAEEFEVPGIVLMSTPTRVTGRGLYLTPLLSLFIKVLYNSKEKMHELNRGITNPAERVKHVSYIEGLPLAQIWQLHKMTSRAMKALPRVKSAALVLQSRGDDVIPPDSLDYILSRIGSETKESLWLERSGHALTVDYEKDLVAEKVSAFLRK
jgi:carboxylesterase